MAVASSDARCGECSVGGCPYGTLWPSRRWLRPRRAQRAAHWSCPCSLLGAPGVPRPAGRPPRRPSPSTDPHTQRGQKRLDIAASARPRWATGGARPGSGAAGGCPARCRMLSMGGAVLAAPVTVPLMLVVSRRRPDDHLPGRRGCPRRSDGCRAGVGAYVLCARSPGVRASVLSRRPLCSRPSTSAASRPAWMHAHATLDGSADRVEMLGHMSDGSDPPGPAGRDHQQPGRAQLYQQLVDSTRKETEHGESRLTP